MNRKRSVYQFMAKALVIVMIFQGMPLWELSNTYKWEFDPGKLQKILDVLSVFGPAEALAMEPVKYEDWQKKNSQVLDFNSIPKETYLTNEFIGQGVLFGDNSGNIYLSDTKFGGLSDIPDQKQIDFGTGEWTDIIFVVPGTTTRTTTTGFGVKYSSMDQYNWVAFYDENDNQIELYSGEDGDNFDGQGRWGRWFLGAVHDEGISRVRVGSDRRAFETYDYEVIVPAFLPEAVIKADSNPAALGRNILFDGSSSVHSDPARQITEYLWDFDDSDGVDFDRPDATGPTAEYAYGKLGDYTVTLKVLDSGTPQLSGTATLTVSVTVPPHSPTAVIGGQYIAVVGEDVQADGSGSYDIDQSDGDSITAWDWETDFTEPYDYGEAHGEAAVLPPYTSAGIFNIGLRVTDNTATVFPESGQPNLTGTAESTVTVFKAGVTDLRARPKGTKCQLLWTHIGVPLYEVLRSDK
ncbi:MAG: PKD domain-containing protein, partial [Desulfobacteraceae bacterium]|nr:PKD domain-containing protein [Desulfobacteraceae bacterium]